MDIRIITARHFRVPTSKCWIFSGFYLTRVSRCGMVIIILCQTVFNAFFKDELRTMGLNWKLCLFFLEKIQKTKSFLYSDFSPQSETVEHSPCLSKVQSLKMFLLIKPKKKSVGRLSKQLNMPFFFICLPNFCINTSYPLCQIFWKKMKKLNPFT